MYERPENEIELLLRHATVNGDFQHTVHQGIKKAKENNGSHGPAVDYLLETMDWEIFGGFRKKLDSPLVNNPSGLLFHNSY
ncbi:MAG: hypothetical protein PVF58_20590 [Candidatus Methanofastidiosia archaeon]